MLAATLASLTAALFVPAGRLDWPMASALGGAPPAGRPDYALERALAGTERIEGGSVARARPREVEP